MKKSRIKALLTVGMIYFIGQNAALAEEAKNPFFFDVPDMEEVAEAAGIDHQYTGPWEYFVGGGVASFDCNQDRMPDVFLAGGKGPAQLFVNRSKAGGKLKFEASKLGLPERDMSRVLGAYPINLDNDAFTDLVVLRLSENILLKGLGDCKFEKTNRAFSFEGGREWTTGFSAVFERGSDFPTLAFGNYVDRTAPGSPWGTCHKNQLIRPADTAKNVPDYSNSIALEPGYCSLSILFTDWNGSGEPALRITNDRQYYRGGEEQLWQINAGMLPKLYTQRQGWKKLTIWGMGISETDLDKDGRPDYALSSMGDTMLQTLNKEADEEQPDYRDIAFERAMTAHRPYTGDDTRPSTGWHTQFADFNNDARTDLFIAKGNVESMPDFASFDPDNMLLGGHGGTFHEMGEKAGIALNRRGRGAVVEDFNADGMLDLLVVNRSENVSLFQNKGLKTDWGHAPMGNWLSIELLNGKINPAAIGAKITVKTGNLSQSKTIQIGGGHASGQIGFSHFGLGVAERATVRIQWPDGDWSPEYRLHANNFVQLRRDNPEPLYWYPRKAAQ
ncbi:MAG: CRTAC1 family protein [Salaquimonas sp.]